ncbi:terminase family protein [Dyella sp. ASV21]|uniref:terminase large subunit domain-containing protein n=1 Tax=Dyella sp. ASV21 TaxID=2795114 RepID=UPI0018EAC5EC|nr:terminase family protein [Dyella sp. ASV21]
MLLPPVATDPRTIARSLYFQGWSVTAIAAQIGLARPTVESWKQRDGWACAKPIDRVDAVLEARLCQLIAKERKDAHDFKEIDLLTRQVERIARVHRYEAPGGHEGHLNPNVANRNAGPKKKPIANEYSPEQAARLREAFMDSLFEYQRSWYNAGLTERIRAILKSRQIGATWYFAREALVDAIDTGRNQIFLSASRSQANEFRKYMVSFAMEAAGIELKGGRDTPIILPNDANLYYLGTNSRTAQGYHGNLYFDEFFWVHSFIQLRKLASGMAIHKKWRQTLFSTPSALSHDAYPFWSGAHYNKGRAKADRVDIDVSHAALAKGVRCADGMYRQIVTVLDAQAGGCDLFDLDQLRLEYSADEFQQLLMCQFIDDTASVFPFALVKRCMVDSWDVWEDFRPYAPKPIGDAPVSIGFDPSKGVTGGDPSGCTVNALPEGARDAFRVLEKHQWPGQDFDAQAGNIKRLRDHYNVVDIAIDTTGMGTGVYQLVKQFFPQARAIQYSPESKAMMVMKTQDVMGKGRLEWDAGWTDLAAAFMAIRKTMTPSGRHVTYDASRSADVGHADLAWSVMHSLIYEPLEGGGAHSQACMEIF